MFSNIKIGYRLGAGFAVVLFCSILIAALGVWRINALAQQTQAMMDVPLKSERLVGEYNTLLLIAIQRTTTVVKSNDPQLEAFLAQEAAESSKKSADTLAQVEKLMTSDEEKKLFANLSDYRKKFLASRNRIYAQKKQGNATEVAHLYDTDYLPVAKATQEAMQGLLRFEQNRIDEISQHIQEVSASSEQMMLILEALMLVAGIACAAALTRSITRPIGLALKISQRVSSGDLTAQAESSSRDELGQLIQSLQGMSNQLHTIVANVRSGSDNIAVASGEIASGNMDLSSRTEAQAGALEETAAAIEELTSSVQQNADNSQQAHTLVTTAAQVAREGNSVMSQLIQTMSTINDSSRKIVDIIGVIDSIAFQTNILALNAAVESARAGELGRGFAVVAAEVRALAQRSAAAAKEIKSLINDSVHKVDAGSKLVEQAGTTMSRLVDSVQGANELVSNISSSSHEQAEGVRQINRAITQMDGTTQQNAALVEEAAAAAQSLNDQTSALKRLVGFFKLSSDSFEAVTLEDRPMMRGTLLVGSSPLQ